MVRLERIVPMQMIALFYSAKTNYTKPALVIGFVRQSQPFVT